MRLKRRNFLILSGLSSFFLFSKKNIRKNIALYPTKRKPVLRFNFDAWIELNFENMKWNLDKIRKLVKVPVMAVIKANGYGHGLVEVGHFLEKRSIDYLMVGKLQEALLLRETGVMSPLLNFGPFSSKEVDEIIQHEISQSVFSEEVQSLSHSALKLRKKAKIHIHIDTGMGRMGIPYYKALPFIEKVSSLKGLDLIGISTTLTEDYDFDREQLRRFLSLCQKAEKKRIFLGFKHAASSSGILNSPSSYLDMVRPGIALYGYYPSEKTQKEDSLSLKPVLQLKARVVAVKALRAGDSVSYHRSYRAKKSEKIAIIPVGYSDGYPFNVVNKASVLIRGKRFPIIATITANHMEVLLREDSQITVGDEIVLLGFQGKEKIAANELARWAGVSAYKILLGLNPLLPKIIA